MSANATGSEACSANKNEQLQEADKLNESTKGTPC